MSTFFFMDTTWLSGSLDGRGRVEANVPGQQLGDAVHRVVSNAVQDFTHVSFRIQAIELGRAKQAVEGCGAFAAAIGACKKVVLLVLPTKSDRPQRPLCHRVVDLNAAVIAIAHERIPASEGIVDGRRGIGLAG